MRMWKGPNMGRHAGGFREGLDFKRENKVAPGVRADISEFDKSDSGILAVQIVHMKDLNLGGIKPAMKNLSTRTHGSNKFKG
ncbi:hypothetical protein EYZ11_006005 [Aspergillus tanneri]|uniref:Uncharacterized protein n=1 Tax=Aspergillus tanneri TaxID=1220188 RepID=A0A4S3JGN0_9EURO|nr:hypothetical protein EYZ11_006005 [Aspergillus tanneri]